MEKTFIPVTGRSYWTNSSRGLRSSHQPLTLYIFVAAIVSSVKQFKQAVSSERLPDLTPPFVIFSFHVHRPSGEATGRLQGENVQPAGPRHPAWLTSTLSRHWIKRTNSKEALFSFTPFAPWDEDSRTTHTLVAKPSLPSPQYNVTGVKSSKIGSSTLKGTVAVVIKIQRYIFFFFLFC